MAGATIDLGVYSPDRAPEPGRAGRWWRPWRAWPRHRRARLRRRLGVALAALTLVPLAADVATPAARLEPVWTVPDSANARPSTTWSRYALARETLYMTVPTFTSGWDLIAYRLADGAVRWRIPLDGVAHEVGIQVVGGVPVVTTRGRLPAHAAAYAPDTGQLRWHHDGYPVAAGGGRVLLRHALPAAEPAGRSPPAAAPYALTALDLATGRTAWRVALGAADQRLWVHASPAGGGYLATLRGDGRLVRHDLATGELTATVDTAAPDGAVWLGDALVLLSNRGRPGGTAYDATTLAARWRAPDAGALRPCGPVVCAVTADGVRGVDPVTGATRWSLPCFPGAAGGPGCRLDAHPLGPAGRLWVGSARGSRVGSWVVDARTGERLADLGRWQPWWRLDGSAWGASWLPDGLSAEPERQSRQVWLARLPADLAAVEVLGHIEAQSWQPHREYVVSWHERDGIQVWRIR